MNYKQSSLIYLIAIIDLTMESNPWREHFQSLRTAKYVQQGQIQD